MFFCHGIFFADRHTIIRRVLHSVFVIRSLCLISNVYHTAYSWIWAHQRIHNLNETITHQWFNTFLYILLEPLDAITWRYFPRHWPFLRGIHLNRWIPLTKANGGDVFCDLRLNKRLCKHLRRRWFETPSRSFWRHCNDIRRLSILPRSFWLKASNILHLRVWCLSLELTFQKYMHIVYILHIVTMCWLYTCI